MLSYLGSFSERRLYCNAFPGYAIFKLMSEIVSCQIRDGFMLPSVNCFLWCIIQQALVVAVQTELSNVTGEADGGKTDSIF